MLQTIKDNWETLNRQVRELCEAAGRSAQEVTIVGVSKYVDVATTKKLVEAGCLDLGESRPQQLWGKASELADRRVRWHLIGHLQRNKVRKTVPYLNCLHSLDSMVLAQAISECAESFGRQIDCFLEVNIAGEDAKTGLSPEQVGSILPSILDLPGIKLVGLMGMASDSKEKELVGGQFQSLRQLRDRFQQRYGSEKNPLNQLSMGMSNDFPIAIACGATHIRVGSRLFSAE